MAGLCEGGNEPSGSLKAICNFNRDVQMAVTYWFRSQRQTSTTQGYKNWFHGYRLIFMEFVEQLDDVKLSQGYFQQDGATCHTSNESMELIASFFDDRIISRNLWPPRSPDLTTPDFFLWGYLKDRVYATLPQTLDDLKHNITQEIQAIDNRVLQ
ncbi:hypothetical protein ANN_26518 [Periplaneta americana]|uniref:Transposase n=1 Tax=Periplaneta americana TaxID=6978 RepID=A0ABQ8RYD0_PERAM|nr:hypothetical protein ANN_26518 [Periplaneta americana]